MIRSTEFTAFEEDPTPFVLSSFEVINALGVPSEFFTAFLSSTDDWTFLIKTHALIESSVSFLLKAHFKDKRLNDVMASLDLGNQKYGKLKIVKDLSLLCSESIAYIDELLVVRNKLVHNIENTSVILNTLGENKLGNSIRKLLSASKKVNSLHIKSAQAATLLESDNRKIIWFAAFFVLVEIAPLKKKFDEHNLVQEVFEALRKDL